MDKIWVLAEQRDGAPLGIVLELLTAARGFGGTVEAFTLGPRRRRARRPTLGRVRGDEGLRRRRHRRLAARPEGGRGHRGPGRGRQRPRRDPGRARPTTAVTSPDGCRSVSTGPCSPTSSASRPRTGG